MFTAVQHFALSYSTLDSVLHDWKRQWPSVGVMALLPEAERMHVELLQSLCNTHQVTLVGAVFPALIAQDSFQTQGVVLLALQTMPPCFLLDDLQRDGAERMAQAVRQCLAGGTAAPPSLFLVFDAMVPNIGSLLDRVHQALDEAPLYAGVNAGSESFAPMPCLFDNHRLVGDGVLGLLLDIPQRVAVRHAYPVSESLMRATSATGNRIVTINNRPAFDVYREVIAQEFGVALTRENFYDHAVHFPFGVVTVIDVLVRIPVALDSDGSLVCVGEIPPHASLRLLRAPAQLANSECVAQLSSDVRGSGAGAGQPFGLLTFYCAGRRMHFGAQAADELAALHSETGAQALFGALSLGEIDCSNDFDFPRFHNAALVCLALPGIATQSP